MTAGAIRRGVLEGLAAGALSSLGGALASGLPDLLPAADAARLAAYLAPLHLSVAVLGALALRAIPWLRSHGVVRGAALAGAVGVSLLPSIRDAGPTARERTASGPPPVPAPHAPVVLIGLDGADPARIRAGIEAGELPTFARLLREGRWGDLRTIVPTESPALWTTIATGRSPEEHGIDEFVLTRFAGVGRAFGTSRPPPVAGWVASRALARRAGLVRYELVSSRRRRVPTVWGLASGAGERVAVVHWWATWPAEPVNGWLVTDRLAYHRARARDGAAPATSGLTHPADLASSLAPSVVDPDAVPAGTLAARSGLSPAEAARVFGRGAGASFEPHEAASELPFLIALDETYGAIAHRAAESLPDADLYAVYLRGIDIAQHAALAHDPRENRLADREDARRFGEIVRRTYAWTDAWLAGFLRRIPADALVFVVSDHGMRRALDADGRASFHHDDAPPGIAIAWGRGVAPGRLPEDASIFDVAPSVLHALGLPVPVEMRGRAWECAAPASPVARVRSWETGAPSPVASIDGGDEEAARRLRAIGYLR